MEDITKLLFHKATKTDLNTNTKLTSTRTPTYPGYFRIKLAPSNSQLTGRGVLEEKNAIVGGY
jgi:hypothetical protein